GRLGDTPFDLGDVELLDADGLDPAPAVMVPKSVLNDLRRQAVERLLDARAGTSRHAIAEPDALAALRAAVAAASPAAGQAAPENADAGPLLHVLVRTPEQLAALLDGSAADAARPPGMAYLDLANPRDHAAAVARCRAAGVPVGVATLRIARPDEQADFEAIVACEPDAVLVRNLAAVSFFREHAPRLPLVGDYTLNAANEVAAAVLAEWGLARLTTSLDLNAAQWAAMVSRAPAARFEAPLHLHVPLMHMEHCLLAARVAGAADRRACGRPCADAEAALQGRVGVEHPLVADARCRTTLFNGRPQTGVDHLAAMRRLGVRHFRVELLRETPRQTVALLGLLSRALAGDIDAAAAREALDKTYPAGVTPGTWDFE
ncbi:MAG: DUF3656 domain-containing protein, partial [Planctomycetes bacterium]|nr:DUF3656 domain-containing protein [Planctomycetota bacterium]